MSGLDRFAKRTCEHHKPQGYDLCRRCTWKYDSDDSLEMIPKEDPEADKSTSRRLPPVFRVNLPGKG